MRELTFYGGLDDPLETMQISWEENIFILQIKKIITHQGLLQGLLVL